MSEKVVLAERDGSVVRLTIDRPQRRNAINTAVVRALSEALTTAEADADVHVCIISGAGDKAFCAGGDLTGMVADSPVGQHLERSEVGDLFQQMRASRLPIIARVNGHALAGGFGLMLACDLVVAVDEAAMGTPEINLGLWPFMISALIQRDLPRKLALELMLTGRRIDAAEGLRWGFVNKVVPRSELDGATAELADAIASKSPLIASLGKSSYYRSEDMDTDSALEYLASMLTVCLASEDTVEGVTAFLSKREPQWKGR